MHLIRYQEEITVLRYVNMSCTDAINIMIRLIRTVVRLVRMQQQQGSFESCKLAIAPDAKSEQAMLLSLQAVAARHYYYA